MAELIIENKRMKVFQKQLGEWDNLNHLLVCKSTGKGCIVDPFDGVFWAEFCRQENIELVQVWLTHSHWDHVKGIHSLPDCEIFIHEKEYERGWNGGETKRWTHARWTSKTQNLGNLNFEIHVTPGHTPGHITIVGESLVISGDCLFLGRCGRVDLFGSSEEAQRKSLTYLKYLFLDMEPTTVVLPGHQYPLPGGENPTWLTVEQILQKNEAIHAVEDDDAWEKLGFLSFDDNLAEQARRKRAMNS